MAAIVGAIVPDMVGAIVADMVPDIVGATVADIVPDIVGAIVADMVADAANSAAFSGEGALLLATGVLLPHCAGSDEPTFST